MVTQEMEMLVTEKKKLNIFMLNIVRTIGRTVIFSEITYILIATINNSIYNAIQANPIY